MKRGSDSWSFTCGVSRANLLPLPNEWELPIEHTFSRWPALSCQPLPRKDRWTLSAAATP